ncbi:MAG: chemotaxis protein CheA [Myxococcales bacterium]|nr:chemotaxis protein CheA [Myxococcales bacterium]
MTLDPKFRNLFDTFFEEAAEGLTAAEGALLNLRLGDEDEELVNLLFRSIHSIKGGGGTFGFTHLGRLSHVMETLLDQVREGARHLQANSQDLLLESVDCLRCILIAHKEAELVDIERCERLSLEIERILDAGSAEAEEESSDAQVEEEAPTSIKGWELVFRPFAHFMASGNDPYRLMRLVAELGNTVIESDFNAASSLESFEPEQSCVTWRIELSGDVPEEDVRDIFSWVEGDDCELELVPLNEDSEATTEHAVVASEPEPQETIETSSTAPPRTKARASVQMASSSIRVSVEKIDSLVNLVGELVITQSMLAQVERDSDLKHVEELRTGLGELERNTRELQETVMRIRMLPIGTTFARFPRLVHDLGRQLGKNIDLQLSGEGTELDKTVLENIGDPLVHLVRNSVDHGIETPEVREAAGKDPMGTILLSAFHQGGSVVIEVRDDGAGVNRAKLLSKAVEKGVVDADAELSDDQILEILFHPGLSTAEQVSDVSGRGVGMDVVKRNIESLGGAITVFSEEGVGSLFRIRLPLTLAIIDGQLVRIGDEIYIIPLVNIVESLQVDRSNVTRVAGPSEVYRFREEALPLVHVSEVFSIPKSCVSNDGMVVVVEGDGRRVSLVVDELLGIQQVVVKSLDTNYERVPGLSGATILGDGAVALILDMAGLIRLAQRRRGEQTGQLNTSQQAALH